MNSETENQENPNVIVPATVEDLPQLTELLMDLFEMEGDFEPNHEKQEKENHINIYCFKNKII